MTSERLNRLRSRAYHWWEWATGIRGASELEAAGIDTYFRFLDTSEVVEYARPSSLLRNQYPTRLDLSLNLLFGSPEPLYMTGPHDKEIQYVARGWQQYMRDALAELKVVRERLDRTKVSALNEDLQRIHDLRSQAEELLDLLRKNYRWLFAEMDIRKQREFEALLTRIRVPSLKDLGVADTLPYASRPERVDWWQERLNATEGGEREPLANLIDALALDQIEHVVSNTNTIPILLTHSGKIFEALRTERRNSPEFFKRNGVSLVQTPQTVLVLRLRRDAKEAGTLEQLTAELTRQQARGEEIYNLLCDIISEDRAGQTIDSRVEDDLKEFEENWRQWDALRQVLQTLEQQGKTFGMLSGLEKILHETPRDETLDFQKLLMQELDKLITDLDRLQGQIANRLAPPEAPEGLYLQPEDAKGLTRSTFRLRLGPRVRSAVSPISSFRFSDPEVLESLKEFMGGLESTSEATNEAARARVSGLWDAARDRLESENRPEPLLLLAVLYLHQEKWIQAYDMATRGLALLPEQSDGAQSSARAELLLARAGARRAFVHALRMDFPTECREFLQGVVEDCLQSLAIRQLMGDTAPDRRCLRELAVTFCSSHDPVYGPPGKYTVITLTLDSARAPEGIAVSKLKGDPLLLAEMFARQAREGMIADPYTRALFANTHLYAMTDIDRRLLDNNNEPKYEKERIDLANELASRDDDPNFLDTLMWHSWVLARRRRLRNDASWYELAEYAKKLSTTLRRHPGLTPPATNQYYHRLVDYHQRRVEKPIRGHNL